MAKVIFLVFALLACCAIQSDAKKTIDSQWEQHKVQNQIRDVNNHARNRD